MLGSAGSFKSEAHWSSDRLRDGGICLHLRVSAIGSIPVSAEAVDARAYGLG